MKLLIILTIYACGAQAVSVPTDLKTKMTPKANAIPPPQKELYYPTSAQSSQTEFLPMQVVQKPFYYQHTQPQATMLIIAQPAYVPQHLIYGAQAGIQQPLLNYINGAQRYPIVFGGAYQPQPTAQAYIAQPTAQQYIAQPTAQPYIAQPTSQPYIAQHPIASSTVPAAAYQVLSPVHAVNHLVRAQPQYASSPLSLGHVAPLSGNSINSQYVQPMQLSQISQLAQMAAQQYAAAPMKSIAPIITGLENFTPEQQAQIKAQLGAQLGTAATTAPSISFTSQSSLSSSDFMQNQDKNSPQTASSNYSPLLYKTQYTKG